MEVRLGCDVGGTFTDVCLVDPATGRAHFAKVPTTTGRQAEGVLTGTGEALARAGLDASAVTGFSHGTTVATNAILERRGAVTALLVTRGFRDLVLIGRQTRPHLYDARARRPPPLVPRALTFEVPERMGPDGAVREPLGEAAVEAIAETLRERAVASAAVVLLHSYANPAHERRVGAILRAALPDIDLSLSVDILPEPGEVERASTTIVNAYIMPPVRSYLTRLARGLADGGIARPPVIMQSNGGVMTAETAGSRKSVHTCLSGPAAGLIGARAFAGAAGFADVVAVDMGGTSFDVGLVRAGRILTRHEGEIEGLPLRVPMFDITTLGAGGGSIARIDEGGLLKVGPESAGAEPGPAAYGRGGVRPTVTDANAVLGRLRDGRPLGGRLSVDRARAKDAIDRDVAGPLGLSTEAAADGILRVVNAAMIRGIRRMTVERGLDPRDFALLAYGGAGPLHAVDLAAEIGIGTVLIPPSPGLLCAIGLLLAPWRHDFATSLMAPLGALGEADIADRLAALRAEALAQAMADRVDPAAIGFEATLDLRYVGQGHPIAVPFRGDGAQAAATFHALHREGFGYGRPDHPVEATTLRLSASAPAATATLPVPQPAHGDPQIGETVLRLDGRAIIVPLLARDRLRPGTRIQGPAIIEQEDTTIVLGPQTAEVHPSGTLIVRL